MSNRIASALIYVRPYRKRLAYLVRVALCVVAVVVAVAAGGFGSSFVPQAQAATDVGHRDFSFAATGVDNPTGEKPQSKLWFNDGKWWGVLFNRASEEYRIYRFDRATQAWTDTGTLVDERNSSKADVVWDEGHLYVASAGPGTTNSADGGRLMRYSYDATTDAYTLDAGFPQSITEVGMEAIVLERDTTGKLWVTYTRGGKVYVSHSLDATGRDWTAPYVLPVAGADNLTGDDISSVVSFDSEIGVMWSNQAQDAMYFAVHADGAPDDAWRESPAVQGPNSADDHINLKSLQADSQGRIFAAVKTSLGDGPSPDPNAPLILLLARGLDGNWSSHVFGRVADDHTRPIVQLDKENGHLYVFATAPVGGGTIYYKRTSVSNIDFGEGRGTPFVQSSLDPRINDATSTKQALNGTTDLLVQASDRTSGYYVHNYLDLADTVTNTAPTVSSVWPAPGSKIQARTPTIRATIRDAQTDLDKDHISLFLDGNRISPLEFSYNRDTDGLSHSSSRLAYGYHSVRVTARDEQGLTGTRTWRFRVVR